MMKLYLGARPHLHTLKAAETPGRAPAASMFQAETDPHLHGLVLSHFWVLEKTWGQG